MSARCSYHAIGWRMPLTAVVQQVAKLGFRGIEAFALIDRLQEEKNLAQVLTESHVDLSASYFAGSFVETARLGVEYERFKATLREILGLGGRYVVVGGGSVKFGKGPKEWGVFIRTVGRLAQMAGKAGVQLAFHPHFGEMVCTSDEIERFAHETDPRLVKFAFDTAHLAKGGADPVRLFEQYIDRIAYVHFKDLRGDEFVELGRGSIAIPEVYRILQKHGYDGWITVELDSSTDPKGSATINAEYLKKTLGITL